MYYAAAVAWAEESGIVNGVSESEFAPDRAITREELAAILYRYAAYKGYDVTARADLAPFADAGAVSPYAVEALQWATAEGLIQGITPAALAPQGGATPGPGGHAADAARGTLPGVNAGERARPLPGRIPSELRQTAAGAPPAAVF